MSGFYILYHSLIFSAFLLALYSYRKTRENIYMVLLLVLTLATELLAEVLISYKLEFVWAYHIYTPINYTFLALHFHQHIKSIQVKKIIIFSIIGFCLFCLIMSSFFYKFKEFPGLCITVDGFLVIIICIYYLFNINPGSEKRFFKSSEVWIAVGLLFFFGGTSFFNGVYTALFNMDKAKAIQLFSIINKPLNIFLYLCFNIAMLCSIIRKKSFTLQ